VARHAQRSCHDTLSGHVMTCHDMTAERVVTQPPNSNSFSRLVMTCHDKPCHSLLFSRRAHAERHADPFETAPHLLTSELRVYLSAL
jgi:hypothetical protein